MTLRISSNFDSGAIEVLSIDTPDNIRLRLRADQGIAGDSSFRQWFHFRLHGAAGLPVRMVFENASEAAYPDGWPGYRCVASYDRHHWFRITGTRYENGQLIVEHTPERNGIYYAYFEPYSHERHLDLLGRVGAQIAANGVSRAWNAARKCCCSTPMPRFTWPRRRAAIAPSWQRRNTLPAPTPTEPLKPCPEQPDSATAAWPPSA